MFLDGEVLVCVAGYDSLIAMMDMVFLMHTSVWPKDFAEFSKYLPPTVDSGTFICRTTADTHGEETRIVNLGFCARSA